MAKRIVALGGGPGGYVAALRAAQLGAQVTVVEARGLGGTCLHRGCIPTKAMAATAGLLTGIRRAKEFGLRVSGDVAVDLAEMVARKNRVVQSQAQGIEHLFKAARVALVRGVGVMESPRSVAARSADGRRVSIPCDAIIVATGSEPAKPGLFPFDGDRILTSDDVIDLTRLPPTLLIVGGGVTGCEFACIFRALGSEVTVVEQADRLVAAEDEAVSAVLQREMKKQGIRVVTGVGVTGVDPGADAVRVALSTGEALAVDRVLVAVGRSLNSREIGAEAAGLRAGPRGELVVDERMETGVDGVWAIGDVTGRKQLAHAASAEGEVAAARAMGLDARMDFDAIPAGIFTFPEIGSIGLTEAQARASGCAVSVGEFLFRSLAKAHILGETAGFVKVVTDTDSGALLGVHIIGPQAAELIHEAVVAMRAEATVDELIHSIHVHPTLAEVVHEAAGAARGVAIHAVRKA
jgi:dihydrolipoamide dehydrogenase